MKRHIVSTIICFLMCFAAAIIVLSDTAKAESHPLDKVVDNADLLSDDEEEVLLNKVNEISERQKCDIVIVTVQSLENKTATEYADVFFDYNGYGAGKEKDGILFLLSMDERKWAISTHGYGIYAFTDADQEYIMDKVKPLLSDGDYNSAFTKFAEDCDEFITQAKNGESHDISNLPKEKNSLSLISIAVSISAVISLIIMFIWRSSTLTSVKPQNTASQYEVNGSMRLIEKKDMFLYKNVVKTRKPKVSNNNGSGSSTHTSSSGSTHGGSSGSF